MPAPIATSRAPATAPTTFAPSAESGGGLGGGGGGLGGSGGGLGGGDGGLGGSGGESGIMLTRARPASL